MPLSSSTIEHTKACLAVCGDAININLTLFGCLFGLLFLIIIIFGSRFQNQKIYLISLIISLLLFIFYFAEFSKVCGSCGQGGVTFNYRLLPSSTIPKWLHDWLNQVETKRLYDVSI